MRTGSYGDFPDCRLGNKFGGFPGSGEILLHMAKVRLGRKIPLRERCFSITARLQSLPGADLVLRDSIRRSTAGFVRLASWKCGWLRMKSSRQCD